MGGVLGRFLCSTFVLSSYAIISFGEERAKCFTVIALVVTFVCLFFKVIF